MDGQAPLSDSEGSGARSGGLHPPRRRCCSRTRSVRIDLVTGVAETRDAVMALTEKYSDPRLADRVFELAWTHSQILLRQLNATEADAQVYGRLAGSIIYASALRRAKASVLDPQSARTIRTVGLRHLGRPADRAGAHPRPRRASSWCARRCRRMPTGG